MKGLTIRFCSWSIAAKANYSIISLAIQAKQRERTLEGKPPLIEATLSREFQRMILSVTVLHDNSVMRRDIKPSNSLLCDTGNILPDGKNEILVKLVNFRFAEFIEGFSGDWVGTAEYKAPKLIEVVLYDTGNSLLTRTLGRETRLKKTSNTRLSGFLHILILQFHKAIRRSVLEPNTGVRNPCEITSLFRKEVAGLPAVPFNSFSRRLFEQKGGIKLRFSAI
jgi:serine/threonine protein kinase